MAITRVTTDGITDNAVSTAKIGANAVDTTKIGTDVIVADDIADNAITVAQIQDGAITAAKIADNTITGAKLNSTISGNRSMSGDVTLSGTVRMPVAASDPGSGVAGQIYYNTTSNVLKFYTGSAWEALATAQLRNSTFDIFGDNSTVGLKPRLTTQLSVAAAVMKRLTVLAPRWPGSAARRFRGSRRTPYIFFPNASGGSNRLRSSSAL